MNDNWGGIEAGGTKFVCAIGRGPGEIVDKSIFPTTDPEETLARVVAFFNDRASTPVKAIGLASFGPVCLDRFSDKFGFITNTPKPGWADTDIRGAITRSLARPVFMDTDVNGAALAEYKWGAGQGLDSLVYLTVGTGIGGGALVGGRILHGLVHPEMGHMILPAHPDDPFPGVCRFHGHCLEGMASGKAIEQRWGARGETLPTDHPAWELESHYLALGAANLICILSPRRIIMGGGVMQNKALFPLIRDKTKKLLNGYIESGAISNAGEDLIAPPALGKDAGVLGALALALAGTDESDSS